jgi:hypothetical protein
MRKGNDARTDLYDLVRILLDELRHHPFEPLTTSSMSHRGFTTSNRPRPEIYAPRSTDGAYVDWGPDDEGGPHDPACWGWTP